MAKRLSFCKKRDLYAELSFELNRVVQKIDQMDRAGINVVACWKPGLEEKIESVDGIIASLTKLIHSQKIIRKAKKQKKEIQRLFGI